MCAKKKIQPTKVTNGEPFEITNDEFINELMEQRRLQQDALQKIMTFMEKEQDILKDSEGREKRKRKIEKIFSTDKKKKNK